MRAVDRNVPSSTELPDRVQDSSIEVLFLFQKCFIRTI